MTEKQKKLLKTLEDMFQFDQSDLDFGIYRIMGMKRGEVKKFIYEDLPKQINEGLNQLVSTRGENEILAINKQIDDTKASSLSDAIKSAAIAELEEKKKAIESKNNTASIEADVYSHLTNFFARYYDDGDFISQRRYKDGVYAIPYEGEEVKLHWANADQYYVKTSEYFKDYTFKTNYGDTVHFKIVEAETEKDNNKSNEKLFFQLHIENPFEIVDNELFIYIEYKNGGKKSQKDCNDEIISAFTSVAKKFTEFAGILNVKDGKTLLERQLNNYTARNTFDYFIHKDLNNFLSRELDFYIKNDVIFLDDIEGIDEAKTKEYLTKAKVIRKIAKKIIVFLAQIENFQKKLFLKKKFIVETNFCITLDKVPKSFYDEIISNPAQIEEWKNLFAIDELKGDLTTVSYSEPLKKEFLEQNKFLVLDTALFPIEFKDRLIDTIDDLDENLNGLMIHSENFQALNLLQEGYLNSVNCLYIDPPYNTEQDRLEGKFLYKDNYAHSTWISMMVDRLMLAKQLQNSSCPIYISINEDELYNLKAILDNVYGDTNYLSTFAIKVRHENRILKGDKDFHEIYESLLAYRKTAEHHPCKREEDNTSLDEYVYAIDVLAKPSETIQMGGKVVEVFDEHTYKIHKVASSEKNLKKISVRGSLREGNSSGRFYVAYIEPKATEYAGKLFKVPDMGDDGLGYRFFWCPSVDSGRKNGDYFQGVPVNRKDTKSVPYPNMYDFEKDFNNCTNEGGISFRNGKKPLAFLKHVLMLQNIISNKNATVLDYFAGSGSTGHAVIDFNREDGGKRKYILVEMGNYFDSVTKPRIKKVIYSKDWKDGKPVSRKGSSHAFKYIRLESYEDALNNIKLDKNAIEMLGGAIEEYMLSYMLDIESKDSDCLLNIEKLAKPFSYEMNITRNLESKERNIDLVETFNYLIGLRVERNHALSSFDADFTEGKYGSVTATLKDGNTYKIKMVEGQTLSGESVLIIWRELTDDTVKDNAVLDAFFNNKKISTTNFKYKKIYVNGDNNLQNTRSTEENWKIILIEEEMKKRMFESINQRG